ncbi:hypothetical protein ANTPLA_LOCUS5701 [Anthophora plagiata]
MNCSLCCAIFRNRNYTNIVEQLCPSLDTIPRTPQDQVHFEITERTFGPPLLPQSVVQRGRSYFVNNDRISSRITVGLEFYEEFQKKKEKRETSSKVEIRECFFLRRQKNRLMHTNGIIGVRNFFRRMEDVARRRKRKNKGKKN